MFDSISYNLLNTIVIMIIAGILGGIVNNHYTPNDKNEPHYLRKCIILGIGASFIIPLFLYLIRSELLNDILIEHNKIIEPNNDFSNSINQKQAFLVYFSFCLLASISAFKFIPALSDKFMELGKRVDKAEEKAIEAEEKAKENRETIKAVKEKIIEKNPIKTEGASMTHGILAEYNTLPCGNTRPIIHSDDPEKGRWGGKTVNNNRQVSAKVNPIDKDEDWFKIILTVTSTDPVKDPLTDEVIFILHDSFSNPVEKVLPTNGIATLSIVAWGAFTVGICVEGKTELEIDLSSNDVDAPRSFKNN